MPRSPQRHSLGCHTQRFEEVLESPAEATSRRLRKRKAAVDAIKPRPEYTTCDPIARPRTPDPTDLTISKREWEKQVMVWRQELRIMYEGWQARCFVAGVAPIFPLSARTCRQTDALRSPVKLIPAFRQM